MEDINEVLKGNVVLQISDGNLSESIEVYGVRYGMVRSTAKIFDECTSTVRYGKKPVRSTTNYCHFV